MPSLPEPRRRPDGILLRICTCRQTEWTQKEKRNIKRSRNSRCWHDPARKSDQPDTGSLPRQVRPGVAVQFHLPQEIRGLVWLVPASSSSDPVVRANSLVVIDFPLVVVVTKVSKRCCNFPLYVRARKPTTDWIAEPDTERIMSLLSPRDTSMSIIRLGHSFSSSEAALRHSLS